MIIRTTIELNSPPPPKKKKKKKISCRFLTKGVFSVKLFVAKGRGGFCRRDRFSLAVEGVQNYEDSCRRTSSFPESDYPKRTLRIAPLGSLNETRKSVTIDTYSAAATRRSPWFQDYMPRQYNSCCASQPIEPARPCISGMKIYCIRELQYDEHVFNLFNRGIMNKTTILNGSLNSILTINVQQTGYYDVDN